MKPGRIILAAIGLVVAVWSLNFIDQGVKNYKITKTISKRFLQVNKGHVTKVTVERGGDGSSFTIVKKGNDWWMADPVTMPADLLSVNHMLEQIEEIYAIRDLGALSDLASYGLDTPAVIIIEQDGIPAQVIKFGDINPNGTEYFTLANDDKSIYLADRRMVSNIVKNSYTIREKKFFRPAVSTISGFALDTGDVKFKVEKGDAGWGLVEPISALADQSVIDGFLNRLTGLKASAFIEDGTTDLMRYGLDKPSVKVSVTYARDGVTKTLLVGGETDQKNRYAMLKGGGNVTRIPVDVLGKIPASVFAVRDKSILSVNQASVNGIKIATPELAIKLESSMDGVGDSARKLWKIVSPVKIQAYDTAVSGYLYELNSLKASGFAHEGKYNPSDYGLDNPIRSISVISGAEQLELKLAKRPSSDDYYASVTSNDVVYVINSESFKKIAVGTESFRDRRLLNVKLDEVSRLVVERMGQRFDVRKGDKSYLLIEPERAHLTASQWNAFLWRITAIRFKQVIEEKSTGGIMAGMDKPVVSITLFDSFGTVQKSLKIGDFRSMDDSYYAKLTNSEMLYTVDQDYINNEMVNALERLLKG